MLLPWNPLNITPRFAYAAHMATHFASPNNTHAPQSTHGKMPLRPQEDIGSVLERFHKWAGERREPVRELTYEEAVARSRRRTYAEDEPLRPEPPKAAASPAPVAPPPPIPFPLVYEPPPVKAPAKPSRPSPRKTARSGKKEASGNKPVGKATAETTSAKSKSAKVASRAKARPAKKASAAAKAKPAAAAKAHPEKKKSVKKAAPKTKAAARKPSPKASVRPSPANSTLNAAETVVSPAASTAAASAYAEVQKAARQSGPGPLPETAFAEVLAAQMQPPAVEPPSHSAPAVAEKIESAAPMTSLAAALTRITSIAPLPDDAPAVHLTMRLASGEREALLQRAHDLGMTPSAYVRQCALQMDLLRTELKDSTQNQEQAAFAPSRSQPDSEPAQPVTALCRRTRGASRHAGKNPWLQRLRNFAFPHKANRQGKAKGRAFAART